MSDSELNNKHIFYFVSSITFEVAYIDFDIGMVYGFKPICPYPSISILLARKNINRYPYLIFLMHIKKPITHITIRETTKSNGLLVKNTFL